MGKGGKGGAGVLEEVAQKLSTETEESWYMLY